MSSEVSQSAVGAPVHTLSHDDDYWTADPARFDIDLDYEEGIKQSMAEVETQSLWHRTCLQMITAKKNDTNFLDVQHSFVNDEEAMKLDPSMEGNANTFQLFYISRILQNKEDEQQLSDEEQVQLRVSPTVLRHLASAYHIPSAFLTSMCSLSAFRGTVFRHQSKHQWHYWCLIPCRFVSVSNGMVITQREAQVNPWSDLYLESQNAVISGYTIGVYIKRDCATRSLRVFVVDHYNTSGKATQEPLAQIQSGLERRSSTDLDGSPCFVLLVHIAFVLRWWDSMFFHVDAELVSHEITIQNEIENETEGFLNTSKALNAALHAMAAHLHRYRTELQRIDLVLSDLRKRRKEMTYMPRSKQRDERKDGMQEGEEEEGEEGFSPTDRELEKIEQLASYLKIICCSADEAERKIQNILALLFNQIQAINDKTLQAILNASQQENRISQRLSLASHMLSRSMKRDSIAMKTIAIMTLVFLPGATFAAVFAMPFFTENKYLSSPSQIWIWVIFTAICTAFAFGGYIHLVKRGEMTLGDPEDDNGTNILSDGTTSSNAPSMVGNGGNTSSNANKRLQRVSERTSQGSIELGARPGS